MRHGQGHATWTWTCSINIDLDMQYGHGQAKYTMDMHHGYENSVYIDMQHGLGHGHTAWYGHAAWSWICNI
jgi:hypothetical protein